MKHNYEQRKQQRIASAYRLMHKNEIASTHYFVMAAKISDNIPLGQPVLLGHHSEKRHRRDIERINNYQSKSVEASQKVDYYKSKIQSIESNDAISSDDPQALEKLEQKIASLQAYQQFMKDANVCIRKRQKEAFLNLPGASVALWEELIQPGRFGGDGYAHFELTNNNANIRRIEKRILALKQVATFNDSETTIKGILVRYNTTAGRLQLVFPAIPSEAVRHNLKRSGFNWSPTEGAWQRMLNNAAISAAKVFLRSYDPQ